ncbi:MAG: hypothetical protein PHY46_01485 [Candidatus Omnitrophica bacterium]|nr:hypothetical protein [Candidatus Omnitrophota bacterium]
MRKIIRLFLVIGLAIFSSSALAADTKVFNVYTDANSPDNHYIASGYMGDYADVSMDNKSMSNPNSGSTCIKVVYSAKKTQGQGWVGIYWQNPPNNWGSKKGGFDLTGMTKLSFWMKGEKGGEIIDKVVVGGIKGLYPDSSEIAFGPFKLTDSWKEYTVNLAGKDLSYISGGFSWIINSDSNPQGSIFYIDDVKFIADTTVKPETKKQEEMPFYVYSDRGAMQNHFIASGYMGDTSDIKTDLGSVENPYSGSTCIKIEYNNNISYGARWAGVYWQNPANNWGGIDGGLDLSKATKITFWARGEKGNERIEEFKVGGILGEYSDSDSAGIGPVILTKEWKQYTIDLTGKDVSYILGGFCWSTNIDVNPDGIVFYLDEIKYE